MKKHIRQKGTGKFGLFILTIIIIIVAYAAIKYVPIRINAYEFQDYMERIARDPAYPCFGDKTSTIQALLLKAKQLNLPITEPQIKINWNYGNCEISVDYEIIINTPIMQKKLEFHPSVSEKRIL